MELIADLFEIFSKFYGPIAALGFPMMFWCFVGSVRDKKSLERQYDALAEAAAMQTREDSIMKVLSAKGSSKAEKMKSGSALSQRQVMKPAKRGVLTLKVIREAVKAASRTNEK